MRSRDPFTGKSGFFLVVERMILTFLDTMLVPDVRLEGDLEFWGVVLIGEKSLRSCTSTPEQSPVAVPAFSPLRS